MMMVMVIYFFTPTHVCLLQNLQVMKVKREFGVMCFVAKLNRTTALPQAVLDNEGTVSVQLAYV